MKDIRLKKNMNKKEVNLLVNKYILLMDDIFLGSKHKHSWRCKCGNEVVGRTWDSIKSNGNYICKQCYFRKLENKHKKEINKADEYVHLKSFFKGDVTPNGRTINKKPYSKIKHLYCGNVYEIETSSFIMSNKRCGKCCGSYENSFAYHIEQELGEPLEKYWDFEKNTVNPYYISRSSNKNIVFIKCQKKDYHPNTMMSCNTFVSGSRCGYCHPKSHDKIHPYDSFGYHNFDKVMSWHPDNGISPFRVSNGDNRKYKFICESCGGMFEKQISNMVNRDEWCINCSMSKGEKRVVLYLDENDIQYKYDKPYFDDLLGIGGNPLRPDFILPDHKIWIEYDGEFHYRDMTGNLENNKIHDSLKNEYAKKHGWKLIRIPYWEFDNIENILEKEIN